MKHTFAHMFIKNIKECREYRFGVFGGVSV